MSTLWTTERVIALAPDPGSSSAGQALGSPSKWKAMARSERAIWGLCQGSGKDPYQVRIDLSEPAFKCSCPSRKFPCKHGIGLLLCLARNEKSFATEAEPGWVVDWFASRGERAEKRAAKAADAAAKPVDEKAQAARQAKREDRVREGVAQCRAWLDDLARRGLAAAQTAPGTFWEQPAARMVDAQATGLANAIRRIAESVSSGERWQERTLDLMGRLHLLLTAAEKLDTLPPDLAGDVRTALGWTQSKDDALTSPDTVPDRWVVLGQILEEEDRLRVRRSWLVGRASHRRALVLDFSVGNQPLDPTIAPGTEFHGELSFYPSTLPLRAIVKARQPASDQALPPFDGLAANTCEQALQGFAEAVARLPWLARWPIFLSGVSPTIHDGACVLVDADGKSLPVRPRYPELWRLVSISAGRPVHLMGEWDGEHLLPLSILPSPTRPVFENIAPRWTA